MFLPSGGWFAFDAQPVGLVNLRHTARPAFASQHAQGAWGLLRESQNQLHFRVALNQAEPGADGQAFRVPHLHLFALYRRTYSYSRTLIPSFQICFEHLLSPGDCAISLDLPNSSVLWILLIRTGIILSMYPMPRRSAKYSMGIICCNHHYFYSHIKDEEINLIWSNRGPQSFFWDPGPRIQNFLDVDCILCSIPSTAISHNKVHQYLCIEMFKLPYLVG